MALLFKRGALTSHQESSVRHMVDKYPHAILLSKNIDYDWAEATLTKHTYVAESGSSGQGYIKTSHLYGSVQSSYGIFYFFEDKRDYDAVSTLTDIVVDANPFQTIIT